MSKMIFGFGSTFMGVGDYTTPEGTVFYIVFKDTGKENPCGLIADDQVPLELADAPISADDVVFFFNTQEQRDRVFASFNG